MSDIIAVEQHKKRLRFKIRLQMIAIGAAVIGGIALGIVLQAHVQSAVLGGIGVAGIGVALIFFVWARIYSFIVLAKWPTPPNFR